MSPAALRALADAADALARLARAAADDDATGDSASLLPLPDAARAAATSVRVIREAIRGGDLAAVGRQRDRAVKRGDLNAWIESRKVRPIAGPEDRDIDRRIARLSRRGRTA